jgi:hypothetical protein
VGREQRAHAEALAEPGHRLADGALADDAERGAGEVTDRVREKAELPGLPPVAVDHVLPVADNATAQRQDESEGVLGNSVDGVAPHVGDDDAALATGCHVNHVVAGGRHGDHPELRQVFEVLGPDRYLVGDRDLRAGEAPEHLAGRRCSVLNPLVAERRLGQLNRWAKGAAVEKDNTGRIASTALASLLHARYLATCAPVCTSGWRSRGPNTFSGDALACVGAAAGFRRHRPNPRKIYAGAVPATRAGSPGLIGAGA